MKIGISSFSSQLGRSIKTGLFCPHNLGEQGSSCSFYTGRVAHRTAVSTTPSDLCPRLHHAVKVPVWRLRGN